MALALLRNWLAEGWGGRRGVVPPPPAWADVLAAAPAAHAEAQTWPESSWTMARVAVEEDLWGHGFMLPGGEAEVLRLAAPIGLSAAATLLLPGTGAGGPATSLAAALGVWVAGYEADPALAILAARRIQRAGTALAKRAAVAGWTRQAPDFGQRSAHHALAFDPIREATPEPVLAAIAAALRPHGQVVLLETVAPRPLDGADPAVAAWCRLEGRERVLPQPEAVTRALRRLGFDVRIAEDVSARHMRLAMLGWRLFVRRMAAARPTPAHAAAVVTQAEMWMRRLRLMHGGTIRLMRWHAMAVR
jgi:cyclopropane fatty-acyl-phospholipid synthase-like methyltransferase